MEIGKKSTGEIAVAVGVTVLATAGLVMHRDTVEPWELTMAVAAAMLAITMPASVWCGSMVRGKLRVRAVRHLDATEREILRDMIQQDRKSTVGFEVERGPYVAMLKAGILHEEPHRKKDTRFWIVMDEAVWRALKKDPRLLAPND